MTSLVWWKTELKTGTKPICFVKFTIPSRLFSCCSDTIIAAPAMNPMRVAFDRKSIMNPSLEVAKNQQNGIEGIERVRETQP